MTIQRPGEKIRSLRRTLLQIIHSTHATPRQLLSLAMRIQSAAIAIFSTRLYTQNLLRFKNQHVIHGSEWDKLKVIPPSCKIVLQWWQENLTKWNSRSFLPLQSPSHTLYTDSSNTSWGAHLHHHHRISGLWTTQEVSYHINWKEMRAVQLALQTFHDINNTTSAAYLNKQGGTRSLLLSKLAIQI